MKMMSLSEQIAINDEKVLAAFTSTSLLKLLYAG